MDNHEESLENKVTVAEIIHRCNDAVSKMGVENPHRYLLYLCASALSQLVDRLSQYEGDEKEIVH
jgi:hypothetical protein